MVKLVKESDPLEEQAKELAAKRFARFGMVVLISYIFLIIYFIITMTLWLSR